MRTVVRSALAPLAAAVLLGSQTSAFAVDYLTVQQAQSQLFAQATQWSEKPVTLTAEQLSALGRLAKTEARSANWKLLHALDTSGKYLGTVVVDQVIGKYELITYAVGVDATGHVKGIEILSYRESHGSEIRLPAWRGQFTGKTAAAALKTGEDIALISGATLSCNHVTDGVRRIVVLLDVLRSSQQLPLS